MISLSAISLLVVGARLAAGGSDRGGGGDVVCSVEEYVRVGLEFEACQKEAMIKFLQSGERDICPSIKKMEDVCSSSVKKCFTARGYERGKQIFFDSMSQAMPEVASCPVVTESARGMDQMLPGERCTVREEIDSVQAVSRCSVEMKAKISKMVRTRGVLRGGYDPVEGTYSFLDEEYGDSEDGEGEPPMAPEEVREKQRHILCTVLGGIKEKCMLPNLRRCYIGHDFQAHLGYLMESLKISGNLIAISLTNVTDVPDCPVFATSPVAIGGSGAAGSTYPLPPAAVPIRSGGGGATSNDDKDAAVPALLAAAAAVASLVVLAALVLVVYKLRLVPRIKAWASNVPYDDMLVTPDGGGVSKEDDRRNAQAMQRRSSERETEERQQQQQQQSV